MKGAYKYIFGAYPPIYNTRRHWGFIAFAPNFWAAHIILYWGNLNYLRTFICLIFPGLLPGPGHHRAALGVQPRPLAPPGLGGRPVLHRVKPGEEKPLIAFAFFLFHNMSLSYSGRRRLLPRAGNHLRH